MPAKLVQAGAEMNSYGADLQEYRKVYLSQGIRPDGRDLTTHRSAAINVNSLANADGSALVKLGHTTCICGIKGELVKPKIEEPNKGSFIVNLELPNFCSPKYSSGPPCDSAQASTSLLANILANSDVINLEQLCIEPGKLVWVLYIDVICMSHDGGVIEAALAAATAALRSTTLPKVTYNSETNDKKVELSVRKELHLKNYPFAATFALFDGGFIVTDPTGDEEQLAPGLLSIVHCGLNAPMYIHMPGGPLISSSALTECIEATSKRVKQMARLVIAAITPPER